jgi:hypothetical protein
MIPEEGGGDGGAWCGAGTACCSIAVGGSDKLACYYTQTENIQAFQVAAREQMQCANAFRVGSNNSSFLTKSAHAHLSHFWQGASPGLCTVGACYLHVRLRYILKTEATGYSRVLVPICRGAWRLIPDEQSNDNQAFGRDSIPLRTDCNCRRDMHRASGVTSASCKLLNSDKGMVWFLFLCSLVLYWIVDPGNIFVKVTLTVKWYVDIGTSRTIRLHFLLNCRPVIWTVICNVQQYRWWYTSPRRWREEIKHWSCRDKELVFFRASS